MRLNHDCVRDVMLFIEEEQELGMALHLPDFLNQKSRPKADLINTMLKLLNIV